MAQNDAVKEFLDWCTSPFGDKEIYESIATIRAKYSDARKFFEEQKDIITEYGLDVIQAQLLPCPHCGGTAVEKGEPATVFFGGPPHVPLNFKIKCYRCSSKVEQSTIEKTIAAWNKRVD